MVYKDMIARVLVIAGSVAFFLEKVGFKWKGMIVKIFTILVAIAGVYLMFRRDYYLPFLGKCVFPNGNKTYDSSLLSEKTSVSLKGLPPNSKVVYWAAKRSENNSILPNPMDAYDYENADVGVTNEKGEIEFRIECPSAYKVKKFGVFEKIIPKHVHYRYEIDGYKGLFSRVYTKYIAC